jgi:type II/III secretion system protein
VNIVSNPHVLTSENKKAVINVSTSVPIVTGQQTSTVSQPGTQPGGGTSTQIITGGVNQTVEYRDAGVVLTVTPRIGERGTVALDVKQEVNSVGAAVPPTNSPSFIKREAETSVVLLNNQTLVLGGLIQDKLTVDDRGIPVLKNIPIIGYLFGFKEKKLEKTELLLLITPRVVGTALDAARITEEMRQGTPDLNRAIQSAPRAPTSTPPPSPGVVPLPGPSAPAPPQSAPATPAPPAVAPAPVPPVPTPPPTPIPPPRSLAPSLAPASAAEPPPPPAVVVPVPHNPEPPQVGQSETARPVGPRARPLPRSGPPIRPRVVPFASTPPATEASPPAQPDATPNP